MSEQDNQFLNEIRIIKQLSLELLTDYKEYLKIKSKDLCYNKNYRKKNAIFFCKKFMKDQRCKWCEKGECSFASSFEDLDDYSKVKIYELGIQAYYYIFMISKEKNKSTDFFDFILSFKSAEKLYEEEIMSLNYIKEQYNKLHEYVIKLKKELQLNHSIFPRQLKDDIERVSDCDIFNSKSIDKIKTLLDDQVGCKICYRNIIDLDEEEFSTTNSSKFVSLSCGHSICEQCHINMINKNKTIFIKCPVCRNKNKIEDTKPNYELNEQILKLKILIKSISTIFFELEDHIENLNKKKFTNKIKSKKNEFKLKSNEAPW